MANAFKAKPFGAQEKRSWDDVHWQRTVDRCFKCGHPDWAHEEYYSKCTAMNCECQRMR